jgi:hypothetical protein
MDWNKGVLMGAQVVVVIVLGTLVALGKDSAITDALMVVSGSLAGTGLYQALKPKV